VTLAGTLVAANGGTGQSSYTIGDLLYASGSTALSKLADVATGNALISGGVGVAPSWGKIGLTTHVSGTLAVGNGGTGATTLTTRGVLIGNGTNAVSATAAGTSGQVLVGYTGADPSWANLTSTAVTSLSFGSTGLTPSTATQGAITVAGTLVVANGGTGATTLTSGYLVKGNGTSAVSASIVYDNGTNVGIGTASPQGKLDVQSRSSGVVTAGLILDNRITNSVGTGIDLRFYVNDGGDARYAAVRSTQNISGNYADLRFLVSNSASPAEAMRIDSGGNVGIGDSSPAYKLTVAGDMRLTGGGDLRISSATGTTTSGGDSVIYNDANNMIFATGTTSAERMRVTSAGLVGIGASSPQVGLHVLFTDQSTNRIRLQNTGASGGTFDIIGGLAGASNAGLSFFDVTNSATRMYINSVGHVLINETSASSASLQHNFEVNGDIMSNGSAAGLFWANRSTAPSSASDWYGWYTTGGTIYIYNPAVGNLASINPSTGAYTALSDAAKKKDFEPSSVGLDAVKALKPTLFRMATDAADAPKQLGFIAQEVKDHIPQAYVEEQNVDASGEEAVYIGLNDRPIIAALVKAVQELEARVAELEGK
jgi:hypothetical protein